VNGGFAYQTPEILAAKPGPSVKRAKANQQQAADVAAVHSPPPALTLLPLGDGLFSAPAA
jgi:hypothetical protein